MCFRIFPKLDENGKLGTSYRLNAHKLLIDLGGLDLESIRFDQAAIDCDLVRSALTTHPKEMRDVLQLLLSDEQITVEKLDRANAMLKELGLTEEAAAARGGGLAGLVIVAIICIGLLLLKSCDPEPEDIHGNPENEPGGGDDRE